MNTETEAADQTWSAADGPGGRLQELFDSERNRYEALANGPDAQAALDFAVGLEAPSERPNLFDQIKAAAMTDMGSKLRRADLVERGAEMFGGLVESAGRYRNVHRYNHANALFELFNLHSKATSWVQAWLQHRNVLHEARREYLDVARDSATPKDTRLQAYVNAANSLSSLGRSLEAIGLYDEALAIDPEFGMALGNRGLALAHYARYAGPHFPMVMAEAHVNVGDAVERADNVRKFGGGSALKTFEDWLAKLKRKEPPKLPALPKLQDPYWLWCVSQGLLLHVSPRCLKPDQRYLDPVYIDSIVSGVKDSRRIADVLDSLNVMKADFAAARYTAWQAMGGTERDPQLVDVSRRTRYADTGEYARHDMFAALARQAFAACNNLLDKTATFLVLYFEIPVKSNREIYFRGWWHDKKGTPWPSAVPVLERNWALFGLCDLSEDLGPKGMHGILQSRRDAATHRFLVPHEYGSTASSRLVDRLSWGELKEILLVQLRVARAAEIYLVAAVAASEKERHQAGRPTVRLPLTNAEPIPPL